MNNEIDVLKEIREYYLQPVIQRDKRWKIRAEALQYAIDILTKISQAKGIVPEEKEIVKLLYKMPFGGLTLKERAEDLYTDKSMGFSQVRNMAKAIRSETLTNLKAFGEKVKKVGDNLMYDFPRSFNNTQIVAYQRVVKKLTQTFLKELGV